ncbi:putative integral membrane protein (TIGR00698 family) [Roseibium hamelinense]|uniref:Putative integral membrane protein (TIGR00698 family) n=1 Tax=Roseibium hamelinense TaxID=150831 RepID=A0A562TH45_9HYPH|nr:YeiH family protein [Roseibium hamelinense]MTI43109.1 YeiH family putative sulfate export transporter [Roseibium hamelinense]TWI92544.1 putative integral membrane protein (TIGR00698 family) [Roseibium hamelinense]
MIETLKARAQELFPGFAIAGLVAIAAQFLNEHYGAPAMLMAILLGMPLNFLAEEKRTAEGVAFSAKTLLRIGVALLGVRISVEMVQSLGLPMLIVIVSGVGATIGFSLLIGRLFGRDRLFSFLSGGAVAICGASAAMAIGSILPKREHAERDLAFTVITVTVLSTLAMIFYPILTSYLKLNMDQTGVFLGGTIHDVAQVVGAGFSISEETGDLSTLVKLIRVTLLAPVVFIAALILRSSVEPGTKRPPLIPGFVIAFLVLATLNSFGLIPTFVSEFASQVASWALLAAIAAVGMKTSIPKLLEVGGPAIWMVVTQTAFLAVFVLAGIWLLG